MTGRPNLGSLFELKPDQWGLRGDPGLWNELASKLIDVPLPESFSALWQILELAYETSVGQPLTNPKAVYVKRFDQGGMSHGLVDPRTWATKLFPLICARYQALVHDGQLDTEPRLAV